MTGDASKHACGARLTAARKAIHLSQEQLGEKIGISKAAISNVEKGRSYPGHNLLLYLHREHRIDFNFMMHGDYAQLPSDVQASLFEAFADGEFPADQRPS
ncbi:helix-turn-helix domain-containing protein [Albibacillus kandeliae]|uniref:helix-turn-helix domain-containing protein n=1 Tax=Albibacillus kandeliae TaxID=2174228 RepID=UPI000D69D508|nr:helix-turn-helix transcriptional regulator [Albibacillus kandeliae]